MARSSPTNRSCRNRQRCAWWLLAPAPQSGFSLSDGTLVMPVQGRTGRERLATFATLMFVPVVFSMVHKKQQPASGGDVLERAHAH